MSPIHGGMVPDNSLPRTCLLFIVEETNTHVSEMVARVGNAWSSYRVRRLESFAIEEGIGPVSRFIPK